MRRIELAASARFDLRSIRTWITKDNASAAAQYLEGLLAIFHHLAQWPMSGRSRDEIRPALRSFAYRKHVIFYRPTTSGIVVLRIVHGRRDLGRIFE